MKKLLTIFLIAIMVISLPTNIFAAEDTDTLTFTMSETSGSKGSDVTLTIAVENNPGMAGVVLTIGYDTEALTLKSSINGDVYPTEPAIGINYVWTESGKNTTANGTLVTLIFTINDSAVEGTDYPISITVRECSNIDAEAVETSTVNGKISVEAPTSTITSANVSLGTDVTVNYYADLDASHAGAQMRFTMHGKETVVDGNATGKGNEYVYSFEGVAPQCMGDDIKAELILGDEVLAERESYSVLQNCKDLLASTPAELGISEANFSAMETLIADLLEYGAQAQLYKNHNTNALVNKDITGQREFVELEASLWAKELGSTSSEGTELTSAGVWFDNVNKLYFKFTAPDITEDNFSINITDTDTDESISYTLSDFELLSVDDSSYIVYSDAVSALDFGHYFTVILNEVTYDRRGNKVETAIQTLDYYGINTYIFAKQNDLNADNELTQMAKLARATYNYGVSAIEYSEAK